MHRLSGFLFLSSMLVGTIILLMMITDNSIAPSDSAYAQAPVRLEISCGKCKDLRAEYISLGRSRDQCIANDCDSFNQIDKDYALAVDALKNCRFDKCGFGWYEYSLLDSPTWDELEYGPEHDPTPGTTLLSDLDGDGIPYLDDMCPNTEKDILVKKDGCPDCGANEVYDPPAPYAHTPTGCSPEMAYIFTTEDDPTYDWRHKLLMRTHYDNLKKFYEKMGYRVKMIALWGTMQEIKKIHTVEVQSLGETTTSTNVTMSWIIDINQIAEYLAQPSTRAISYFGTGGILTHNHPFWWDNYETAIGGHSQSDLAQAVENKAREYYRQQYGLNKTHTDLKATQRTENLGLDYAYIYACQSLDSTSMRDFLLRSGGTYWGEPDLLTGAAILEKSTKP